MSSEVLGYLSATGAALTWALAPVMYRLFIDRLSYNAINAVRSLGYLASAALYLLVMEGPEGFVLPRDPQLLWAIMAMGVVWFVMGDLLWFACLHRLGASVSSVVFSSVPLLAVPGAWFFLGQVPSWGVVMAAFLIVSGLLVLNLRGQVAPVGTIRGGLLFALGAMLTGLAGTLTNAWFVQRMPVPQIEFWRAVSVTVISWGILAGVGDWRSVRSASWKCLGGTVAAGALSLTVGNLFWSYALHYVAVGVATCISATKPFVTTIFAALFLGERITPRLVGGMALVVGGVLLLGR